MKRREFLHRTLSSSSLISLAPFAPPLLVQAAGEARKKEHVLVVLQLGGGNDGLNTVIPYADDAYYNNRFATAISKNQVRRIDDHIGFHPSLGGYEELIKNEQLCVVQGVGYPNPNRSHFTSMDIWHTALRNPEARSSGWLGKAAERQTEETDGNKLLALHLGQEEQPRALVADRVHTPSVDSLSGFTLQVRGDEALRRQIERNATSPRKARNDLLDFVQHQTSAALSSSEQVRRVLDTSDKGKGYPLSAVADKLQTIAQCIDAGLSTRIYYLTLNGFDTHALQKDPHASLLRQFGDATAAFMHDLETRGQADRVLMMTFSEFGRRVRENGSQGTDHGAAAPLFLAGRTLKRSVQGKHPSMQDLDDGDLKFHIDFRQVYATVLDQWLGIDSQAVLGKRYEMLPVL